MIEKYAKLRLVLPANARKNTCLMMDDNEDETVLNNHSEEKTGKWNCRRKRHIKKKISLGYLLKVICASRETCIEWLKNRGLIPRIMFCPRCSRKMKFVPHDQAFDGYLWMCKECTVDPPQFSTRHGSWLESKDAPLVDILLFTYFWAHGFSEDQLCRELNMPMNIIKEWNNMYSNICDSLYQRKIATGEGHENEKVNEISKKESRSVLWRCANKYKDPFLEFLKDADSL